MRGAAPLTTHLSLTLSATLTHAQVHKAVTNPQLNGKRPAQAPDYSATLGLSADFHPLMFSADLALDGEAYEDDLNTLTLKPSRRLNLRADYALTDHLTAYADINNALDDRIQIAHSGDGTLSFDNRRMVTVGLSFRQ